MRSSYIVIFAVVSILLSSMAISVYSDSLNDEVIPTIHWINVYCHQPTLDGVALAPGDTVKAYDPDGVYCGTYIVRSDGGFGFMAIYRDDVYTSEIDEGADPGNLISFKINNTSVTTIPEVYWTGFGDKIEICEFHLDTAIPECDTLDLNEGWNLISWSRDFSGSLDDLLSHASNPSAITYIYTIDDSLLIYDSTLPEYSTLDSVDYHYGYWVKVAEDIQIEICGFPPETDDFIVVSSGWNLIPYWPDDSLQIETALASVYDNLETVLSFSSNGLVWVPDYELFNTLDSMIPGYGYCTKLSTDGSLQYPGWEFSPVRPFTTTTERVAVNNTVQSLKWNLVYSGGMTLDGTPVIYGSNIDFRTNDGEICGSAVYKNDMLKLSPIYMRDAYCDESNMLASPGDMVTVYINNTPVYPSIKLESHGRRIVIGDLYTDPSLSPEIKPGPFTLYQNYPNPFNAATTISFELPNASEVRLSVYNILGQNVATIADSEYPAGLNRVEWSGTLADGSEAPSGVYFYRLSTDSFTETNKMLLMK